MMDRILAGACLAIMLCGATRLFAQTPAAGGEIPLSGHISADMASRLHTALNDGRPHSLRISSSGGEDLPALAIADDLRRNRTTLVVEGICAGPCANYLFLAAPQRTVRPGALVIFTASATSRLAMVPPQRLAEISGAYARTARREKQLLRDAGVAPALLLEPQLGLGTDCYSLTSRDRAGKAYINYRANFIGWTPSRAYLARAGIKVAGFWPNTSAQFQAALQKALPGGTRGNIAYSAAKAPASEAALLGRLRAIRECDAGFGKKK